MNSPVRIAAFGAMNSDSGSASQLNGGSRYGISLVTTVCAPGLLPVDAAVQGYWFARMGTVHLIPTEVTYYEILTDSVVCGGRAVHAAA